MRLTLSRAFRLVPAIVLLLPACSVSLKNHTPPEFPWVVVRDITPDTFYQSTRWDLIELMDDPAHRFLLEIKPKNVSGISAYVTVNGTEHSMSEYPTAGTGSGLWTYEHADECQSSYDFHYRVRYKRGWYGWKNKTLGTSAEPLQAGVSGAGDLVWFTHGESVHPSDVGSGQLEFIHPDLQEHRITIQNLRSTPVALYSIFVDAQNDEFQVLDVPAAAAGPPLPPDQSFVLDCGESLTFRVIWNGRRNGAQGALNMHAWSPGGAGFSMNTVVSLTGVIYPPGFPG